MRPSLRCVSWLLLLAAAGTAHAGRFVVGSPQVESASMRAEARELQRSGLLESLAEALNGVVVLPRDVVIRHAECGQANAYYDADAREISMCIELMQGMAQTLEGQFEDDDSTAEALAGAYLAVALHEAGHALVDVLELPVTGREEDAVDQLAAWLLIEADDVGSVLGAAASYYSDEASAAGDDDFADEHSLDRQRYFNLVCWAYGSDPDNGQQLIDDWGLPPARAEGCAAEYAQLDRSWSRLLQPHRVDTTDDGAAEAAAQQTRIEHDTPAPPSSPRATGTQRTVGRLRETPSEHDGG